MLISAVDIIKNSIELYKKYSSIYKIHVGSLDTNRLVTILKVTGQISDIIFNGFGLTLLLYFLLIVLALSLVCGYINFVRVIYKHTTNKQ
jgi:hypothetical protein